MGGLAAAAQLDSAHAGSGSSPASYVRKGAWERSGLLPVKQARAGGSRCTCEDSSSLPPLPLGSGGGLSIPRVAFDWGSRSRKAIPGVRSRTQFRAQHPDISPPGVPSLG